MPYSKLAFDIERRAGLDPQAVTLVLRALSDLIYDRVRHGESIRIPGLGTIRPSYRKPKRVSCNLPDFRLRGRTYRVPLRVIPFLEPERRLVREDCYPLAPKRA